MGGPTSFHLCLSADLRCVAVYDRALDTTECQAYVDATNGTGGGPPADSCSCPSSGDWVIDAADNCVITTDCDMQGNDVHVTGSGNVKLDATIYNFQDAYVWDGADVNCYASDCFA